MSTTDATYFVSVDQTGTYIEILTVVSKDWILSDEVNFPITIDPTITVNTVSTPGGTIGNNGILQVNSGGYSTCNVATVDCSSRTDDAIAMTDTLLLHGAALPRPVLSQSSSHYLTSTLPTALQP